MNPPPPPANLFPDYATRSWSEHQIPGRLSGCICSILNASSQTGARHIRLLASVPCLLWILSWLDNPARCVNPALIIRTRTKRTNEERASALLKLGYLCFTAAVVASCSCDRPPPSPIIQNANSRIATLPYILLLRRRP
jgi:hypothetical protein